MATQNHSQIDVADSWDDDNTDIGNSNDATSCLPKVGLNVDAPAFVPGGTGLDPRATAFNTTTGCINKDSSSMDTTDQFEHSSQFANDNSRMQRVGASETPISESAQCASLDLQKLSITDNANLPETSGASQAPRSSGDATNSRRENWEEMENGATPSDASEDGELNGESAAAREEKRVQRISTSSDVIKEHVNVVFIGHVDAGKSTIGGHMMYLTGMVDKRTLEKYEREAREKNRESWYLSWALDTNQEERDKGKTVEVGRAFFETEKKHFTILDAPGHKSFVPNMISGASQADLAILVISARRGEFETGFERGGQTREHATLVKTAGVCRLIVLINKMDDPTVEWSPARFEECKEKLSPYLKKSLRFKSSDIIFIPCSGLTGANLKDTPTQGVCPWYTGPTLIEYLDSLPPLNRLDAKPLRIPLVDRYKDMGTIVLGKIESGLLVKQTLMLMPNKVSVDVLQLWSDDMEVDSARSGENVKIKLKGVEEEDVSPGFVLCPIDDLCRIGKVFDAQIKILDHKSIICAGYSCILHLHSCAEEVTIRTLICLIDERTGEKSKARPRFVKQDQAVIARFEVNAGFICLETYKDFAQMGRFTLRDEGKTVAIGIIKKIVE